MDQTITVWTLIQKQLKLIFSQATSIVENVEFLTIHVLPGWVEIGLNMTHQLLVYINLFPNLELN